MKVLANYYQQFDADYTRDVPGEGYGGWKKAAIEIAPARTALVVMHAWEQGTREEFAGWHRAVEYIPRAQEICRKVFPPLLKAARERDWKIFHVVGGGNYYQHLAGYRRACALAEKEAAWPQIASDETADALRAFKREHSFVGPHNERDVARGFGQLDFSDEARPRENEGVAETTAQLFALCRAEGVNHLIYMGFAINYCLMWSPGGMIDMVRHGCLCSAFRQAVTAVENRESARQESHKEAALWAVAMAMGFVFDVEDFLSALGKLTNTS
jgi:hypothetical protein